MRKNRNITPVNTAVIALNVIIFVVMIVLGLNDDNGASFMAGHGGVYAPYVFEQHQYWRLATCMFLHFDLNHLINNMVVLAFIGDNLERAVGKVKYLIIYFGSGIAASLSSAAIEYFVFNGAHNSVSAGASGAIFGLVGALIFILIAHRGFYEDLSLKRVLVFAILSICLGLQENHTDNIAHVAGVVAGFVLCVIVYRKKAFRSGNTARFMVD